MTPPIKHVFVLMLENRSFDHLLGFSTLVGSDAGTGQPTTADAISPDCANLDLAGARVQTTPTAPYVLDVDPPHDFVSVREQLCGTGGSYPAVDNSGFLAAFQRAAPGRTDVMSGYRPEQLPVLNALAREFAICDRWFSSMPGPTWPNRFFIHAASSAGLDDSPTKTQAITSSLVEGYLFANGTIYDRLEAAGIEWRIYHGDDFPQSLAIRGMNEKWLAGRFRDFASFTSDIGSPEFSPAYVFIEPSYGHVLTHRGDFRCGNSQHPLDDITRGERLLKEVYEALRGSPHWHESVLVVTYDEHGGFYDHVLPPQVEPPGDPITDGESNQHGFAFDQLGARVPGLIVSPLIPRQVIDHTRYDHASVLASVEQLFHLRWLTERDRNAASFWHLFSLDSARDDAPTTLPEAAASGFTGCDESLANEFDLVEQRDLEESAVVIGGTLSGFLRVALLRHLSLTGATERDSIVARYFAIQTTREARAFLQVATRLIDQARAELARGFRL